MPPSKTTKPISKIRFKAKLLAPADTAKAGAWSFLVLPKPASAKLPSRSVEAVEGTINGAPFYAMLQPDGRKGHWLKVERKLREQAGARDGDVVELEIGSTDREPSVPADFRTALAAAPKAKAAWSEITVLARRDWIHWIDSAKQVETRARRIRNGCDMLASGKKRVCCFDRSGFYSKEFSAPKAASAS